MRIAIEIKREYKHHDIIDSFNVILDYFTDYIWGAKYSIGSKSIEIAAFVFATLFSRKGFLFRDKGKFNPHKILKGPWDAYHITFTISTGLKRIFKKLFGKACQSFFTSPPQHTSRESNTIILRTFPHACEGLYR
jgi:hypothetical protein